MREEKNKKKKGCESSLEITMYRRRHHLDIACSRILITSFLPLGNRPVTLSFLENFQKHGLFLSFCFATSFLFFPLISSPKRIPFSGLKIKTPIYTPRLGKLIS